MGTLRIVSWNLRTFGDPTPPDVVLLNIAEIIVNWLQADIVCIQEVQIGPNTDPKIGAEVSPDIAQVLEDLAEKLDALEPEAEWFFTCSGINNSDRARSMRDAYAFFWKEMPAKSPKSRGDAPVLIAKLQSPTILRQKGNDHFPGRRPGLATFEVTRTANSVPVVFNLISWHAATPCNKVGKAASGPSSGRALLQLATLPEIGGDMQKDHSGGHGGTVIERVNPLPEIDTIFLGDCNYTMEASQAAEVYHNLITNYQPCVSTLTNVVKTTYSADPSNPLVGSSSYDNIFVLRPHSKFAPSLTFAESAGAIDFIAGQAEMLGAAAGIQYFPTETAWYVCYVDQYKRQYAQFGISDHLPVYADFTIGTALANNSNIKPTSGAGYNCLFHALFGTPNDFGLYVDADAGARRTGFSNHLATNITALNFERIRNDVLSTMIELFESAPTWQAAAQYLLSHPGIAPFGDATWTQMVDAYITSIRNGRMLYAQEAAILAGWHNISVTLWFVKDGEYQSLQLNPGQMDQRDIYHIGLHFFHYVPS